MYTSKGQPVQAVFGFCRMIKKIINDYKPECMAIVWDSPGKTERHEMYTDYKATRQAAPSDLSEQKKYIKQFADAIGLAQVERPGIEADDLMNSLVHDFRKQDTKTVLITSDKDMGQLLDGDVCIFDPFKDAFVTREDLEKKYGFSLEKLPFYFALIGDTSDNIPGVRGIGPKGATDLVQQFNSLEDLYNNLDNVPKERTRELLQASRDNAFLSEKLFKLRYHPKISEQPEAYQFDPAQWAQARAVFEELEFKSLLKEMGPVQKERKLEQFSLLASETPAYNHITVTSPEVLEKIVAEIQNKKFCALDTETDGLKTLESEIVGISLCITPDTAYYIPFGHHNAPEQLSREQVVYALKPILEDVSIKKYLHNAKFDELALYAMGINLQGVVFDTMIAASLITQDWQRLGLKYLSDFYLHESMPSYTDVVKHNGYKTFADVPLNHATLYAATDARQTLRLVEIFKKELQEHQQEELFTAIELPLVQVLYEMEKEGIILDTAVLKNIDIHVTKELEKIRQLIIDFVGDEHSSINLNSPKQLEDLLFNILKLSPLKKTTGKTGYSTDQEVLIELAKSHPVPGLIVKYRELFKLKSTYIDTLGSYINPKTGRIHTHFSQTTTATGRLASSDPNLQNIPVETTGAVQLRSAFKAPTGCVFISADYSQIELRVLAHLSDDETLVQAFKNNEDIHARTAAALFGTDITQVTHDQRQLAKRINFSILYGLTPYGLSKDLDIPFTQAKEYIEKYFAQYPGVVQWMDSVVEFTKKYGYVTTEWGRRRYVPNVYEKNKSLYDLGRRIAINTAAQGTAAELMKLGMINLHNKLTEQYPQAKIILQIHDELLITAPESIAHAVEQLVIDVLQNVVSWDVPLIVTTRQGKDWQEVTK